MSAGLSGKRIGIQVLNDSGGNVTKADIKILSRRHGLQRCAFMHIAIRSPIDQAAKDNDR
jgi:hypothetical protein